MKPATFFGAAAFIFMSAFIMKKESDTSQQLFNKKWALKKIHTVPGTQDVIVKAFIRFDAEKKSAGGNGGCNSFGSSITLSGNNIKITDIFSTKMYCEGIQPTEDLFFKLLEKVNRFEVKDTSMILYRDKEALLEFELTDK